MVTMPDQVVANDALTLSDLDLISPDTVVISFLVYKLSPSSDFQVLSDALSHGLAQAAKQLPPLSARKVFGLT